MKNESSRHDVVVRRNAQDEAAEPSVKTSVVPFKAVAAARPVRLGLAAALGASLVLGLPDIQHAQQRYKEPTVKVTGVTTSGNVVSISADGSLNRAQTWQEPDKFHVVLVNGQVEASGLARGVRAERIGNSLELVIPIRPGASVTVEPRGNRLDLVVSGGASGPLNVENFPTDSRGERAQSQGRRAMREQAQQEQAAEEHSREEVARFAQTPESKRRGQAEPSAATTQPQASQPQQSPSQQPPQQAPQPASQPQQPAQPSNDVVNLAGNGAPKEGAKSSSAVPPAAAQLSAGGGTSLASLIFSLPGLLTLLGVSLLGAVLFVLRRRRRASGDEDVPAEREKKVKIEKPAAEETARPFQQFKGDRRKSNIAVPFDRRTAGRGAEDEASRQSLSLGAQRSGDGHERASEAKSAGVAVQFGAYRVDQEVARLVQGQSHSVEVLNSRATDDRRAVETSLLKALGAPETDEDGQRRARTALEDYGFVARACASLLLGAESFERASAARTLGEMKSARALPFLTEALYDQDSVVRMECVQSLGAIGLPSAIGALLDASRRHQDIPASVLGPALTACSVESLELTWDSAFASRAFAEGGDAEETGDAFGASGPAAVEALPDWIEDETLQAALERLQSADVESRVHSAQQLAQFQVCRAVEALAAMAREDAEAAVRSAAVTSLGLINHESVFAHVIVALADEAREVRAAAARALSRLSFDRADAYLRVMESSDAGALAEVARACVKAGLAAQAINRLASEDRRQAYEAFSLLSLCAKAGETRPIIETVECHRDIEVRLACIRLLGLANQPELGEQLLHIAGNGGVPERVRRAIVETVERAREPQAVGVEVAAE